MAIMIRIKRAIGLNLEPIVTAPGKSVRELLRESGHFDTPGEIDQCRVYRENADGELVLLNKDEILEDDTNLVTMSPILGVAPMAPRGTTLGAFWQGAVVDLANNVRLAWPIFAAIAVYLLGSAYVLFSLELGHNDKVKGYGDAVYLTWITMTTVGFGDAYPMTACGKVVAGVDGLVGIVLIGVVVWLVTESLKKD